MKRKRIIVCPIDREGYSYFLSQGDGVFCFLVFSTYFNIKVPMNFPKFAIEFKTLPIFK